MKQKIFLTIGAISALAFSSACATTAPVNSNANVARGNANSATVTNVNSGAATTASPMATTASNSTAVSTGSNPTVGGSPMYANKDIVDNASQSKDHTTLVAAVKAAGLVETLKGTGPFTVFAPTNTAFEKLPKGTVDGLLQPGSKETLKKVLTYHVVSGKQDAAGVASAIKAGNGKATFKTVAGGTLTASIEGSDVILTDEKGGKSKVTTADVMQSNGVIHVIDSVLMPK